MTEREHVAALVRAIRRAHEDRAQNPTPGGVVQFTVRDIFAFAEALVRAGVTVHQEKAA